MTRWQRLADRLRKRRAKYAVSKQANQPAEASRLLEVNRVLKDMAELVKTKRAVSQ